MSYGNIIKYAFSYTNINQSEVFLSKFYLRELFIWKNSIELKFIMTSFSE